MKPRLPRFKRCGRAPGTLTPEDAAAANDFQATLAALPNPDHDTASATWAA